MKRQHKQNRKNVLAGLLLIIALGVMAFSGCRLWSIHQMYAQGDHSYEQLAGLVHRTLPAVSMQKDQTTGPEIPEISVDFAALQEVNEDGIAWLYNPGTAIDYPVVRATDYDWYLHHLPDGTYNSNGTLFLDYNNPDDFSGRLNIIYGHHMKSGKMFGSLMGYKEQEYFQEHPCLYLYTAEQGNFRIELLYGCVIGAGQWRDRAFMFEGNLDSLLSYASHHTTFQSEAAYTDNDRFLVLSTCSYEFDGARYVVIGKMIPEYSE